jgi:hypothetical protein
MYSQMLQPYALIMTNKSDAEKTLEGIGALASIIGMFVAVSVGIGAILTLISGQDPVEPILVLIICGFYIRWYCHTDHTLSK